MTPSQPEKLTIILHQLKSIIESRLSPTSMHTLIVTFSTVSPLPSFVASTLHTEAMTFQSPIYDLQRPHSDGRHRQELDLMTGIAFEGRSDKRLYCWEGEES